MIHTAARPCSIRVDMPRRVIGCRAPTSSGWDGSPAFCRSCTVRSPLLDPMDLECPTDLTGPPGVTELSIWSGRVNSPGRWWPGAKHGPRPVRAAESAMLGNRQDRAGWRLALDEHHQGVRAHAVRLHPIGRDVGCLS